jgi:hypothetical protein
MFPRRAVHRLRRRSRGFRDSSRLLADPPSCRTATHRRRHLAGILVRSRRRQHGEHNSPPATHSMVGTAIDDARRATHLTTPVPQNRAPSEPPEVPLIAGEDDVSVSDVAITLSVRLRGGLYWRGCNSWFERLVLGPPERTWTSADLPDAHQPWARISGVLHVPALPLTVAIPG